MTHDPDAPTPERHTTPSDTLDALVHPRRLHVVCALDDASTTLSIAELGQRVAAAEAGADRDPDTTEIRISLAHVHLPKLDDAGIVRYDRDARTVVPGPQAGSFRDLQGTLRAVLDGTGGGPH